MLTETFNGKPVCNALSAVCHYYPELTNGRDMLIDSYDYNQHPTRLAYFYAAFRQAADPSARTKTADELINELPLDIFRNAEKLRALGDLVNRFMNETIEGNTEKNI